MCFLISDSPVKQGDSFIAPAWFSEIPLFMKLLIGEQEPLDSFLLPDDVLASAFGSEAQENDERSSKKSKKGAKMVAAKAKIGKGKKARLADWSRQRRGS